MVDLSFMTHGLSLSVSLFEYFDPLTYMTEDEYRSMWIGIFNAMFHGTLARVGAIICLFYAFWYGTYKQKLGLGIMFFVFTTCFAYLGSVARLLGIGVH